MLLFPVFKLLHNISHKGYTNPLPVAHAVGQLDLLTKQWKKAITPKSARIARRTSHFIKGETETFKSTSMSTMLC